MSKEFKSGMNLKTKKKKKKQGSLIIITFLYNVSKEA